MGSVLCRVTDFTCFICCFFHTSIAGYKEARSTRKPEDLKKSCSSATTKVFNVERPAMDSRARTYQTNVDEGSLNETCRLQGRTSQPQESQTQGRVGNDQRSLSCDPRLHTKRSEQPEIFPDPRSWAAIWNTSTVLPVQMKPLADEKRRPDNDCSLKMPPSSKSRYETHRWLKRTVLLTVHLRYAELPVLEPIRASTRILDHVKRCTRHHGSPGGARVWRQRFRWQGSSEQIVTLQIKSPYRRV